MSAAIQEQSPVSKAWPVTNLNIGIFPFRVPKLHERLPGIKETSLGGRRHCHFPIFYEYPVVLSAQCSVSHIVPFTSIGIGESSEQVDLLRFRNHGDDVRIFIMPRAG